MLDPIYKLHWYLTKAREYPGIHRLIDGLKGEGSLDRTDWRSLQLERLRCLLLHANSHVSYYMQMFKEAGLNPETMNFPEDLVRIPLLVKSIIQGSIDDLISNETKKSQIFENASGGSTGIPLKFYQDQDYRTTSIALDAYVRGWYGITSYDRTASVWGADREFRELSFKEKLYIWRSRMKSLNAFRMTEKDIILFCEKLLHWKPVYLMGYATALEAVAGCMKKNNLKTLKVKAITSTAETLMPDQRKLIEEVFDSPVYNFYGSREISSLLSECPEERRLHVISTWRYIEVVDSIGQPVPDGTPGYIVVTDLSNYAMPFIRYRIEDMGRISSELCPCGRPSPVFDEILGRSSDMIITPDGDIVHGEFFTHLFYGRDDILSFQIHQTAIDKIILKYVPKGTHPEEFIDGVVKKINAHIGDKVNICVEVCSEIPVSSSGKHRFTISDVDESHLSINK